MDNNKKYIYAGIFFLCLQILATVRNVMSDYNNFFWFCDFASLPIAIGFFARKENIIKALINIGLIPQLIYITAFIYKLVSGVSVFTTIPDHITLFYGLSTFLIHLSTFFAFLLTYKEKPKINTLFYSLMFLFGMYVVALFFTTTEQGINYVLSAKTLLIPFAIPHYTELWVLIVFLVVILPTQLIQYYFYKSTANSNK